MLRCLHELPLVEPSIPSRFSALLGEEGLGARLRHDNIAVVRSVLSPIKLDLMLLLHLI